MRTDEVAFTVLAGLVGLLVGGLLGVNGFAQPVGTTPLSQTPRIKNLLWLLSGFFILWLADTKRLGLPEDFSILWPFICYGIGAVIGVLTAIGWMVTSIRRSVTGFRESNPFASHIDAGALLREYVTYGKARFDDAWDKAKAAALQGIDQRRQDLEADALAAECIYSITRQLGAQRRLLESDLMDAILGAICAKARAASDRQITLKPSYLAFVPKEDAGDTLIAKAKFALDMPGGCSGYLVLRRGSQRPSGEVVLPVANKATEVLPGAPEAVILQGFSIVNTRAIRFRPNVSKPTQAEVKEFYRHPYFEKVASVASLLVYDKDKFHGVISIESSEPDLLGRGEDALAAVVARLKPLVALLAVFR